MDGPRELNFDVLHLVMSLCQRQEISMMMKTCKLLYLEGARLLLSDVVTLRSEDDIVSFTTFMLGGSEDLDRLYHPLRVHITANFLSPKGASHLRKFLFTYGHLLMFRVLTISHAEHILAAGPYLPDAFAKIDFIGHFSLSEAGLFARAMFQQWRNEVLNVTVAFKLPVSPNRWRSFMPDSGDNQNNPILLLSPLCNTLYSVSGTWGATDPRKDVYEGIIFQHVISLQIDTWDPIHVPHYAHAFPNVVDLTVSTGAAVGFGEGEDTLFIYGRWHDRNRTAVQQKQGLSWSRLEHFSGTVLDWWALALECEVERMEVVDLRGWQFAVFAKLLRIARPKYLVLSAGAPTVMLERFGTLFCQPEQASKSRLKALRIDVSFELLGLDRDEIGASSTLDTLVAACAGMAQLQWLQVNVDYWRLRCDYLGLDGDAMKEDVPAPSAEAALQQLHTHVLARRLRSEIPTLRGVSVRLRSLQGRELDTVHLGDQFPPDTGWDSLDQPPA